MITLFQKEAGNEIVNRINKLSANTQLQVGKLIGRFFKFFRIGDRTISKNSPTNPGFIIATTMRFEKEKENVQKTTGFFHKKPGSLGQGIQWKISHHQG